MSRISHQGSDTAAAQAQHVAQSQQKAANAQGARNGAQFAALYRGTTNFTYGNDAQRGPSVSSVRAKRMADQLARKRRAAKKQRSNAGGLDDDGPDDAEAHHAEGHKVNRDGGGRGGGGHSQGDHSDEHDSGAAPSIKARGDRNAVPPPPPGRLDAIAAQYAQPGQEGARAAAVRDAWRSYAVGNVTLEIVNRTDRPVLVIRSDIEAAPLAQRLREMVKKLGGKQDYMPRISPV